MPFEGKRATKGSPDDLVRTVVAHYLGVVPGVIGPSTRLQRDLRVLPLDLVVIALRLEEATSLAFPITCLTEVRTVGDLSQILRRLQDEPSP